MNDVTATLREIHGELVEKFVGREVENSILLRENMDLYFRFLPLEYLEKYGLRSIDPNEVNDPVTRAENKAFNRSLKEKIYFTPFNPHGKNFYDLIPTFTRRVAIMSGNEITPHTYTSTVVPITTNYGYEVCQLSNDRYSLNEFLNDAVIHLYDDGTDDTPCPSSNICKLTDNSHGHDGQYDMDFNVDVIRGDEDDDKESYLLRLSIHIHKSIPNTAFYIHIKVDFNVEVDNWTESHGDWKYRVEESQLTHNGLGPIMSKEQFNYLLENVDGKIEKVSIRISM